MRSKSPHPAVATFSNSLTRTGVGNMRGLLPCDFAWEKVPEGRMRALSTCDGGGE